MDDKSKHMSEEETRWRSANADAIASNNAYVEQNGVPLFNCRTFISRYSCPIPAIHTGPIWHRRDQ